MGLDKAHEGYEYQDYMSVYFILKEILNETDTQFIIDRKEFKDDNLDDLLINNVNGRFKKQIKYSSDDSNHTFAKANISSNSGYNLSLESLYYSWLNHPDRESTEFRLCLAWNEPIDKLKKFINYVDDHQSFSDFPTKVLKIDGKSVWPDGKLPVSSWRQFRKASKSIERELFLKFCNQLLIEVGLPKFSLNLKTPGDLEKIVLGQASKIGIGIFPNDNTTTESFILSLLGIIRRSRSKGTIITTSSIFHELNTDYGKIEQKFPLIENENLLRVETLENFISETKNHDKIILTGEPGSGKSWFITNLQKILKKQGIRVIKHYCYTRLDDLLQKERIKVNIFFGNLISDILQEFPNLRHIKEEKYASSLKELNLLLISITEPTYLIIDGLDHIDRIFNYRQFNNITKNDIAILDNIKRLETSDNIKIIVTSQNIPELEDFIGFKKIILPSWIEKDIKNLLLKVKVKNRVIENGILLSSFLLEKSSGNPLYVKYLINEVKRNVANLKNLPIYSYNLKEYYQYLLSQLNTKEDVPQVLSGVSFCLTKNELEEITNSGTYVADSLNILSPVLKLNFSQSGYIIYHESFRRFIIDQLKENSVSIERKVFYPVIEWFESKDFFTYRKAYRYYLPFLFESADFKRIINLLKYDFVTNSVVNGQPWDLIEKNYKYFVNAACYLNDFPSIILLNEINKIISSTEDNFNQIFHLYIEALGKIYGFKYVSEYLVYEGKPTYSMEEGLKVCYICDENNVAAPWDLYMEYFKKGEKIEKKHFGYFIRGLIILKKEYEINTVAKKINKHKIEEFAEIFREEFLKYGNKKYSEYLSDKYDAIQKVRNIRIIPTSIGRNDLLLIADEILNFKDLYSNEVPVIENFYSELLSHTTDHDLRKELIEKFKGGNWFYYWVIFYIQIIYIKNSSIRLYFELKEAFEFLQYNTDPFSGNPRTCDLHQVQHLIYRSFQEGLQLVESTEQWQEIIDILVKVSNETTTSFQKSLGGPLTTDTLFKLLSEFSCNKNLNYVNGVFEELSHEKEEYHLHLDIAEYNFRLASLFSTALDREKAIVYFRKGVEYTLAYTMRKDMTLHDAIIGIEFIAGVDPTLGIQDLLKLRTLVDSAVDHTDGKETQYFPQLWFERFLKIDFFKASLFLLNELNNSRYDWRAEKSLVDLLCSANCKIDPIIEFYLALTFPTNDSEKFITYSLNLCDSLNPINPIFTEKLMARVIPSVQQKQNRRFSGNIVKRINDKIDSAGYNSKFKISFEKPSRNPSRKIWYEREIIDRKEFTLMTDVELKNYFEENGILQNDIHSLSYLISQYEELTDSLKEIIQTIVRKNNRGSSDKLELDIVFSTENDIECYYWVCCFFYEEGGWFESFINLNALNKASKVNRYNAFQFLFELLPSKLDIGFNFDFSANLIKALINEGYNKETIISAWKNLFTITSYRLPFQDEIEWNVILENELEMDTDEILICILITRYKAATTERIQWMTSALSYLFENNQDKLIKPIRWFLKNNSTFLDSVLCIVLQLLLEQKEKGCMFYLNFENELIALFPKRYFLIDFILSKLLEINLPKISTTKGLFYPNTNDKGYEYFIRQNKRYRTFEESGIELRQTFRKYVSSFKNKYNDYLELYWSRSYNCSVPHIYTSNYLQELLNIGCYNEFNAWSMIELEKVFNYAVLIDLESVLAHINSFALRPIDLPKPYEFKQSYTIIKNFNKTEWIRLGHYETALKDKGGLRNQKFKSFGGICFSESKEDLKLFPYSTYSIFPFHIWGQILPDFDLEKTIIFSILQDDPLEFYKILWLNPVIVRILELVVSKNETGLIAINSLNETVLKMRTWSCDYIGDSYMTSLSEEIPRYQGTDLIIRKDYFDKLSLLFKESPSYRIVKMEWPVIGK